MPSPCRFNSAELDSATAEGLFAWLTENVRSVAAMDCPGLTIRDRSPGVGEGGIRHLNRTDAPRAHHQTHARTRRAG